MASNPACRYRRTPAVPILAADSLRQYAEQTAAEFEARRHCFENDYALRSKLYQPFLQQVNPEAQVAAARRAALDRQAFEERVKAAKPAQPKVLPASITTNPGMQQANPPYDDAWIDPGSTPKSASVSTDQNQGTISTALAANGSQYAGAGLKLRITPATATDSLLVMPTMLFTGSYRVDSYFLGSATVSGQGEIQVYAYDDQGLRLPEFDQHQQMQIFSASASGLEQGTGGDINYPWSPIVQLQNGTTYELWMLLRNFANTGGNGQGDSSFAVQVPGVTITES
jgi:hypothetical protein